MPVTAPQRLFNAFMGQRRHGKTRMSNAKPANLFRKNGASCFYSSALDWGLSLSASSLNTVSQNQLMNLTHKRHREQKLSPIAIRTLATHAIRKVFELIY